MRVNLPVCQNEGKSGGILRVLVFQPFSDGEVSDLAGLDGGINGVQWRNRRESRRCAFADESADIRLGGSDDAGDGCGDLGVAEIEFSGGDLGLSGFERGFGLLLLSEGRIKVFLRHGAGFGEGCDSRHILVGFVERGLLLPEAAFGGGEPLLDTAFIEHKERRALLHLAAFGVEDFFHRGFDAGFHFHIGRGLRVRHGIRHHGHITHERRGDEHLRRRQNERRGTFEAGGESQSDPEACDEVSGSGGGHELR